MLGEVDSARVTDASQRVERIWRNAMNHYWNRCIGQHDLGRDRDLDGYRSAVPALRVDLG